MRSFLLPILCFALVQAVPAAAQTTLSDLRGSDAPLGASDSETAVDAAAAPAEQNPAQSNVFSLRPSLNSATAETGSSGLGTAGRVTPVRPFADRIAAVDRAVPLGDSAIDDSVFAGDTTFDAAEGIRLGSFTFTPQLTATSGYTDNRSQSSSGSAGSFYRLSPDLSLTSDWSRHELDLAFRGSYTGYPGDTDDNEGDVFAAGNLRLDISEATQVTTSVSYTYSQEDDGSAESSGSTDTNQLLSGNVSATRRVGILAATASVGADHNLYSSETVSESGRDNTLYSASLRLDGNTGSILSPFVEGSLLLRRYDDTCSDALCEKRNANGYQVKGGVTIASGPKVTGELGAGWRIENIEDSRLEDLSGLVVDASLVWSPSRLTTVTAGLGTSFEATDIDNASGSIIYSGDLRLAHAFSDRLVAETGVGYSYRTYEGVSIEERTLTGFGGLTFALTKNIALTTDYTHRRFDSSQDGSDYTENAVEAGLRFRH
ncbi:outer membrane beta-barrel protein [Roseibium sp. M-1]